jgi:hypothetical protein
MTFSTACAGKSPRMRGGRIPEGRLMGTRVWRDGCRWMINAAANIYWYPEGRENRIGNGPTRVEMGDQELAPGSQV